MDLCDYGKWLIVKIDSQKSIAAPNLIDFLLKLNQLQLTYGSFTATMRSNNKAIGCLYFTFKERNIIILGTNFCLEAKVWRGSKIKRRLIESLKNQGIEETQFLTSFPACKEDM